MQAPPSLISLPDECLQNIYHYLDIRSLGRLSLTCRRMFKLILSDKLLWTSRCRLALGSNMNSPRMIERSKPLLSPLERCKLGLKWKEGSHRVRVLLPFNRCMPYMILKKENLFISIGQDIMRYCRKDNGNISWSALSQRTSHFDDISQFVLNQNEVITVGRDGFLTRLRQSNLHGISYQRLHLEEILAVDAKDNIIITGGKNNCIKIWEAGAMFVESIGSIPTSIRILCLAFLPSTRQFIGGFPGTENIHPLQVFDLETQTRIAYLGQEYRVGAGIVKIFPESEFLALSAGYDSTIKLWDLRAPQSHVSCWAEPYENIIYCVKSDYSHTILAGANRGGMFHIFDKRSPNCQYSFYTIRSRSPVYAIDFDASHVFTAVDKAVVQYSYI